ncbi:MAG: diguanylate cyclase, partial [Ignavibacteria bacterium]|nr:diguanylate cyclase [Ignavibacteria bacterium]
AKRAEELLIANKELAFQNNEKEKRAAELLIANEELAFQNKEKEKRAQELLEINNLLFNERQLFEKTLISIGDGVISIDRDKNIIFINTIAEELTGWSKDEASGQPVYTVFNIINEFTRSFDEDIVNKVMVNKTVHILANHTILITKDGSEKVIEDSASPILDKDNDITGVVIIFRDYTEKWQRLKKIEFINYHDQLTGLYNRRFFEEELFRLDTSRNLPLSIVTGDINSLKLVNDSFGHLMGDELLKGVAQSIKDACREDDIIARMGGDEFSIILPKTSEEQTEKLIRRIKTNLSKFKIAGVEASVSFGHGCKKTDDKSIRDIVKAAEDSMYRSKFFGKASAQSKTINIITKTLFEKNNREMLHSERVSKLCELVAKKLEFNEERLEMLKTAGLMHDIGKIAINESILNKK